MSPLAPKWALSSQTIDADGNPYLAPGVHLRIIPSQEFGLPLVPFIVYREDITQTAGRFMRTDVIWTDRRGQVLTPPFEIPPGGSATGWLPPIDRGVCCWIQAEVDPYGVEGMRMDALVHHAQLPLKPAVIGTTTQLPPTLSASRIDRISISGRGVVVGARWIDARTLVERSKPAFWKLLSLPVDSGIRYTSTPGAKAEADDRVLRGAPSLMGRHEERTPFFASTGGAVTDADEFERVSLFMPDIHQWLDQLINDLSRPVHDLNTSYHAEAEGARPMASENLEVNTLGLLMQASMDPGTARYLGFMETDPDALDFPPGSLIAYFIRGLFRFDKDRHTRFLRALAADQVIGFEEGQAILEPFGLGLPDYPELDELLDFTAAAIVAIGHPPDGPGAPLMEPADTRGPFLPATPPEARREVVLRGSKIAPLVALERHDSSGEHSLNPLTSDDKRALPIIPSVANPASTSAQAEIADRDAPPEALSYRIAMADWFGRWGDWRTLNAAAKPRPLPPIPAPNVHYTPPAVTGSTPPDAPLGGSLRIEIPAPPLENMPAGAFPLRRARITLLEGATNLFTHTTSPADPHSLPGGKLVVTFTDHASLKVDRASARTVSLVARWEDTAGRLSEPSPPIAVEIADPRPPESVVIPGVLKYSARPDVSGIARVDLRWNILPTQRRFRVYYADEVGARTYLQGKAGSDPAAGAALVAIDAADNPVDRAAAFKTHAAALGPAAFDQLTREPLAFTGSEGKFVHNLSGSLQVLSLYRVVAVSGSNVEAPFSSSALVPVGVPNTLPPAQPFLALRSIPNGARPRSDRLALIVDAARRPTLPVEYRLRRSTVDSTSALSMPVVESGNLPAPDGENVRIEIEQGLDATPPLRPWIQYFWRVEVRGDPEPGATEVSGQWSAASAPVTATLIPPGSPAPASDLEVTVTATEHTLTWKHPDPRLDGGTAGAYAFEIYQQIPNDRPRPVGRLLAYTPVSQGGRAGPDGSFTFTIAVDESAGPGTVYRLVLYDPMNRASPPATVTVPSIEPEPEPELPPVDEPEPKPTDPLPGPGPEPPPEEM